MRSSDRCERHGSMSHRHSSKRTGIFARAVGLGRTARGMLLGLTVILAACDAEDGASRSSNRPDIESAIAPAARRETQDPVSDNATVLTPSQTIRRINELRVAGRLSALDPFLPPDDVRHVIGLLQSVDRLVASNHALQAAITDALGAASARPFDRSRVANIVGVFSMDVVVLDERVDRDRAAVTIEVGGRLPLEEVELNRRGGRWILELDPPRPEITTELHRLADALEGVAVDIRKGRLTDAAQIRADLERRQKPIGRRFDKLAANNDGE